MKRIIGIVFTALLLFIGCGKPNNPASENDGLVSGARFVIDTLSVSAILKADPITGARQTHIPFKLVYHFEGKPGSLDGMGLSIGDKSIAGIFEPMSPTPVGLQQSLIQEFANPDTFPGQDFLFVRLGFSGRFWERAGSVVIYYSDFSIHDSMWVPLQREAGSG